MRTEMYVGLQVSVRCSCLTVANLMCVDRERISEPYEHLNIPKILSAILASSL